MAEWVVFYENGTTFSSEDGEPSQAPSDGVVVIALKDYGVGRRLLHSADFYCWHKEREWVPHNQRGLDYYLAQDEPGIVLSGYAVPDARWQAIYAAALYDSRLWQKTGWDWREDESRAPPEERTALEAAWGR